MGKLIFGKLLLFALISIMFLHFTEMNAQYNRTVPQRQSRTNVSIDGNELLGRLFKKNKDKEKSKKEKNDKKKKKKKGDVDNSLRNEKDATTRIVEPQLKESSPLAKDEVSLIVSGDGSTKEEATKAALRSAIELAFGTFVSANTKILNDELVKDEIITVSSGNVKNYKYLSEREENGKYYVSLQTTVVVGKLIEYTKSKGGSAELAGATFAMNMKMKKLKEENIARALNMLEEQIKPFLKNCYSFEDVKVGEPKEAERQLDDVDRNMYNSWTIRNGVKYVKAVCVPIEICVKPNSNLIQARNIVNNTADALAEHFTLEEIEQSYESHRTSYYGHSDTYNPEIKGFSENKYRNLVKSIVKMYIPVKSLLNFKIIDNLGEYTYSNLNISKDNFYELELDPVSKKRLPRLLNVVFCDTEKMYQSGQLSKKDELQRFEQYKRGEITDYSLRGASCRTYYIPESYFLLGYDEKKQKKYPKDCPYFSNSSGYSELWTYQCRVMEGYRDVVAYVIKMNLWYTLDEISQVSDIKVVTVNE